MAKLLFQAAAEEEEDDLSLQRPALPIGDCEIDPAALSAPPGDGLEYLRRVRYEARGLPTVIRKAPPTSPAPDDSPPASLPQPLPPSPRRWIPDAGWEEQLISSFDHLACTLRRAAEGGAFRRQPPPGGPALPPIADSVGWETFCMGSKGMGASGQPPLVSSVGRLEQRASLAVLQVLHSRLERDGQMPPQLARWIYALLLRLERALPSDGAAILRALLRTCAELRSQLEASPAAEAAEEEEAVQQAAALNTILCIVGRYFGQASEGELHACAEMG